jgi:hypothetical protein
MLRLSRTDGLRYGRDGLPVERLTAPLELREIEQVADDRFELVGLLLDDPQIAPPCVVIGSSGIRAFDIRESPRAASSARARCPRGADACAVDSQQRLRAAVEIGQLLNARERADPSPSSAHVGAPSRNEPARSCAAACGGMEDQERRASRQRQQADRTTSASPISAGPRTPAGFIGPRRSRPGHRR